MIANLLSKMAVVNRVQHICIFLSERTKIAPRSGRKVSVAPKPTPPARQETQVCRACNKRLQGSAIQESAKLQLEATVYNVQNDERQELVDT